MGMAIITSMIFSLACFIAGNIEMGYFFVGMAVADLTTVIIYSKNRN